MKELFRTRKIRRLINYAGTVLLALPISLIIYFLLPDLTEKFKLIQVESGVLDLEDPKLYYYDLDNDGNTEEIRSYLSTKGQHSVQVFSSYGGVIDQWNFSGIPAQGKRLISGDFNNDSICEVFVFCQKNDSIVLNCIEPLNINNSIRFRNRYISTISLINKELDYVIPDVILRDMNNDGYDDVVFVISAGFSLKPRKVFLFDINNDTIISSPDAGSVITTISSEDIDHDGYPELFGKCPAAGNIHDSLDIPFHDYSAWLFCYDKNLQYKFPPVEFPGFRGNIMAESYKQEDTSLILVLYNRIGRSDSISTLYLVNQHGEITSRQQITGKDRASLKLLRINNGGSGLFLIESTGKLYHIEDNLHLKLVFDIDAQLLPNYYSIDLDMDRRDELILVRADHAILIVSNDQKHITLSKHEDQELPSGIVRTIEGGRALLVLRYGKHYYKYLYLKNDLYNTRYALFLGILAFTVIFIMVIRRLQLRKIKRQQLQRTRIAELSLMARQNQLDPHFLITVINAASNAVRKENRDAASEALLDLSIIIRNTLQGSSSPFYRLDDELEIVDRFLKIQKYIYPEKFDYSISVDQNVDIQQMVPKMIVHTYAENSVKHGFTNYQGEGKLNIRISQKTKYLDIVIEDNGIGREAAKRMNTRTTGKGVEIMDEIFSIIRETYGVSIECIITDRDAQEKHPGTIVNILIPSEFRKLKYGII